MKFQELTKEQFKTQLQKGPKELYKKIQTYGYGRTLGVMEDMDPATWQKWWGQLQKNAQASQLSPIDAKTLEGLNIYMNKVLSGAYEDFDMLESRPGFNANEYWADQESAMGIRSVVNESSLFSKGGQFALRENSSDYLNRVL